MRGVAVIAILAVLSIPVALCAEEAKGPEETILSFRKHLRLGAYRMATDFLSRDSMEMLKATEESPAAWLKREMGDNFHKNFEIVSIKQDGDWATAAIKLPNENTSGTFYLVNEEGAWKISLVPEEDLEDIRIKVKEAAREKAEKAARKKSEAGKK